MPYHSFHTPTPWFEYQRRPKKRRRTSTKELPRRQMRKRQTSAWDTESWRRAPLLSLPGVPSQIHASLPLSSCISQLRFHFGTGVLQTKWPDPNQSLSSQWRNFDEPPWGLLSWNLDEWDPSLWDKSGLGLLALWLIPFPCVSAQLRLWVDDVLTNPMLNELCGLGQIPWPLRDRMAKAKVVQTYPTGSSRPQR